ncbi:MAG: hypothetical protein ACI84D_000155 [Thalassolituus oleivorans]|jgi:hypothetical protein
MKRRVLSICAAIALVVAPAALAQESSTWESLGGPSGMRVGQIYYSPVLEEIWIDDPNRDASLSKSHRRSVHGGEWSETLSLSYFVRKANNHLNQRNRS